jgi:hypothetical protein
MGWILVLALVVIVLSSIALRMIRRRPAEKPPEDDAGW